MKIEYLLFNLLVFFGPLIGVNLYPGAVWPKIKPAVIAIFVLALIFIVWDHLVTSWWWQFNSTYILDIKLWNLPIEEILFFMVIPWSCLVIWENLKSRIRGKTTFLLSPVIYLLAFILGVWGFFNQAWYSLVISVAVMGMTWLAGTTGRWLEKKSFLGFMGTVTGLTLIFNGYLTARPIVIYNNEVISNLRIGTIPLEDLLYGLVLIAGVTILYEYKLKTTKEKR